MKKLSFAIVGAAALALAACGGQQEDTLNADENLATENLDAMAADTANMEVDALANQEEALNAEGAAEEAPADAADANAAEVNAM